jgi:two-component system response regulator ResD
MKKILVVDDEPHIAKLVKNILSSEHFLVDEANTALDALDMIKHKKYDMIVLDVMMPNMNGYELCEKLRENPETYEIPVIFLTAKHAVGDKIHAIHSGADDYITKPFDPEELIVKVYALLNENPKTPQVL